MIRCRPTHGSTGSVALFTPVRALLVLSAALATMLLIAPFAHASLVWSPPQDLTPSGLHDGSPLVATDSQGRATVIWQHSDGTNSRIREVRIAADGTPGTVHTLSQPGQGAHAPQVAVDSLGRATVVWYLFNQTKGRIQERRIRANGTVGAVHSLSAAGEPAQNPQVAIDSHNRATVVWQRYDGTNIRAQATRIAADGTPGAVQTLSATGQDAHDAQVAVDPRGRATVVWQATEGSDSVVQSVRIRADGTPGALRNVSTAPGVADGAQVAVDSRDRATVVWTDFNTVPYRIQSRRINADGTLGPMRYLSSAGRQAMFPQLGIDSNDRATVVWQRYDGSHTRIQSVRIAPSGGPGTVQDLSAAGRSASTPQVAVDPQGRSTVIWTRFDGTTARAQAARVRPDGSPGSTQTLSAPGDRALDPGVAPGPQGGAIAVWWVSNGASGVVQSATGMLNP